MNMITIERRSRKRSECRMATSSMASPRGALANDLTSVLPNSKVIVTGGLDPDGPGVLSTVELYDPVFETWSATSSMGTPRCAHRSVLLQDGRVLVVGGSSIIGEQAQSLLIWAARLRRVR